jgi:signal transduction histidine kinase
MTWNALLAYPPDRCSELREVEEAAWSRHQPDDPQRRIDELESQNAELRMFAAATAHDLNSPLTTIIGYAIIAERQLDQDQPLAVGTLLGRIRTAAARMSKLIGGLQDLAGRGCLIGETADLPLAEAVEEAVDQLAAAIAERGVEFEVAPGLPAVVADRGPVVRVLQNLIENAVRYMGDQPRPRIEISARRQGDAVLCCVRDNGGGIARQQQQRIFEPFESLERKGGCGLGLFIVRRIVEAHGGRVWVESEGEGRGSSFFFTLRAASGRPLFCTAVRQQQQVLAS